MHCAAASTPIGAAALRASTPWTEGRSSQPAKATSVTFAGARAATAQRTYNQRRRMSATVSCAAPSRPRAASGGRRRRPSGASRCNCHPPQLPLPLPLPGAVLLAHWHNCKRAVPVALRAQQPHSRRRRHGAVARGSGAPTGSADGSESDQCPWHWQPRAPRSHCQGALGGAQCIWQGSLGPRASLRTWTSRRRTRGTWCGASCMSIIANCSLGMMLAPGSAAPPTRHDIDWQLRSIGPRFARGEIECLSKIYK